MKFLTVGVMCFYSCYVVTEHFYLGAMKGLHVHVHAAAICSDVVKCSVANVDFYDSVMCFFS